MIKYLILYGISKGILSKLTKFFLLILIIIIFALHFFNSYKVHNRLLLTLLCTIYEVLINQMLDIIFRIFIGCYKIIMIFGLIRAKNLNFLLFFFNIQGGIFLLNNCSIISIILYMNIIWRIYPLFS